MPWGIADVDKHKKGLSEAQKKKWVEIANGVRQQQLDKGKSEQEADAIAIRVANSQVDSYAMYAFTSDEYKVEEKKVNGVDYWIVPAVMLREGVHEGSQGRVLHKKEEISKFTAAWNGIPVCIFHPLTDDGKPMSANFSPDTLAKYKVGRIYGTYISGDKLKTEIWFNKALLRKISPITYTLIENRKPIDVSVGIFNDTLVESGFWHSEEYDLIAMNYRPDHLAVLPGGTGACSWNDGCGIRFNQKGGANGTMKRTKQPNNNNNKGGSIMKTREEKIQVLSKMEIAPFKADELEKMEDPIIDQFYAMYSACSNIRKDLEDQHKEAVVQINADHDTKIQALQKDNEKLKKENEDLKKKSDTPPPQFNEEKAMELLSDQLSDPEKFKKLLSPEMREQFDYGQALYEQQRKSLITHITTNQAGESFKEEDLKDLKLDELKRIASAIKPIADYSLSGFRVPERTPEGDGEVLMYNSY